MLNTHTSTACTAASARHEAPRNNSHSQIWWLVQWLVAAVTLILFLGNVNVVALRLGLPERAFNPLLLSTCCVTLAVFSSQLRHAFLPVMRWALFFLATFVLTATYSTLFSKYLTFSDILARNGFQRYAATLLILLASFCIGSWATATGHVLRLLQLTFYITTFSALSPLLLSLVPGATLTFTHSDSTTRMTGLFFLDPNEYALQSLYAFALGIVLSIATAKIRWAAIGLGAGILACLLALSKTAILCLIVLLLFACAIAFNTHWRSLRPAVLLTAASISALLAILWITATAGQGIPAFHHSHEHIARLEHVWSILTTARLDEETTSSRTAIWKHVLSLYSESPIIGHGLTSMDYVPGIAERSPHNTFLLILAEGGIVSLLALIPFAASCATVLLANTQRETKLLLLLFLVIQLFLWLSLSNSLWIRPQNLMTGCVAGIVTATLAQRRSKKRLPASGGIHTRRVLSAPRR